MLYGIWLGLLSIPTWHPYLIAFTMHMLTAAVHMCWLFSVHVQLM